MAWQLKRAKVFWIGFLLAGVLLVGVQRYSRSSIIPPGTPSLTLGLPMSRENVAAAVKGVVESTSGYQFTPSQVQVQVQNQQRLARIQYSIHSDLQKDMEKLFRNYGPDYGAFVALDARTGRVLSLVSYSRTGLQENLALRASFPSASVFKVVTAAAAVGAGKVSVDSVIPFNGRNHTLYRGQVMESKITHWTRFITLKEAFAQSINTVFGKLGAFSVGSDGLRQYADRFGFNRKIAGDLPVAEGRALIPNDDDAWGLAETASGYTQDNKMSPVQGALIAAAVANEGVMMEPYIVQSVTGQDGTALYKVEPKVAGITMDTSTALAMRSLMKETVLRGTSRSSFRGFFKKDFTDLDVGGKTGSLTGHDPQGKYDWFVGFADSGSHRIAFAALTIHGKKWRVRSSYLARRAIESYFSHSRSVQQPQSAAVSNGHSARPNSG